jgi:hypothetical protein
LALYNGTIGLKGQALQENKEEYMAFEGLALFGTTFAILVESEKVHPNSRWGTVRLKKEM